MKFLLGFVLFALSLSALAQTRVVSIDAFDLAYTGGIMLKHDKTVSGSDRNQTNFRFNLNFAQNLEQYVGLMWKAQFHLNRDDVDYGSNDSLTSTFGASGGLLYNFQPDDIKNSFMAGAQFGLERSTFEIGGDDESGVNMYLDLEGGKRWDLGKYSMANISYAPTVDFVLKRYGGDIRDHFFKSGHEIKLNFLKFDILF